MWRVQMIAQPVEVLPSARRPIQLRTDLKRWLWAGRLLGVGGRLGGFNGGSIVNDPIQILPHAIPGPTNVTDDSELNARAGNWRSGLATGLVRPSATS